MDIKKLLKPDKIAVVGASEKIGMGYGTCINMTAYQDSMENVYFVNPGYDRLFGKTCYHSLTEIPSEIDLVILSTARELAVPLLKEAKTKNCGGAVVFASGYSEMGQEEGFRFEKELVRAAEALNIALMGPNCGGFINFLDSVYAFAFEGEYGNKKGTVGMVSQSGQFCIDMINSRDLKFSYAISAGNSCVVQMEDYLDFLVDEEHTKVVAVYLEAVRNTEKFQTALRKAAWKRKPVVILKAGASPQGAANAASHTGSLAGDDAAYDAVFGKFGVIRAVDLQDLRSTAMLFSTLMNIPKRAGFGAMCMSGGETGICADLGYRHGIRYPALHADTCAKLKKLLPFYATPRNPLDMTVTLSYDAERFAEGIQAFMSDPQIHIGILGYTITDKHPTEPECIMFEGIQLALERIGGKPLIIVPFIESTRYPEFADGFLKSGIPILAAPEYAFLVLRHLADFIEYRPEEKQLCLINGPETSELEKGSAMSEYDSRKFLKEKGLDIYIGEFAASVDESVSAAEKIGYPVVMKVDSPDILHKSDAGCVKTGITGEEEVRAAYAELMEHARQHVKDVRIHGIMIQKMFAGGRELILGIRRDPQLGLIMLAGFGGIYVEIFQDISICPLPVSYEEARSMLESLKSCILLEGFRGEQEYDKEALIQFMLELSDFACRNSAIEELDLNPVFVFEKGKGIAVGDVLLIPACQEEII